MVYTSPPHVETLVLLLQILPPTDSINLSSPPNIDMCQFARLAQAKNLLRFVLAHISDHTYHPAFREEEVMQLDRTLHSLIELSEVEIQTKENSKSCAGMSLCRRYSHPHLWQT